MNKNLIILKIGGSVLTDKSKPFSVNKEIISSVASQIKNNSNFKLIIVHGGGAFGHPLAKKYNLNEGITKKEQIIGISETHKAMLNLNNIVVDIFLKNNIPVIALSPIDIFITENGRIKYSYLDSLYKSLELNMIPILFGDTVYDTNKGVSILSGDQIVTYIGIKLHAKKIILATDIDGLYTSDPKINPEAKLIKEFKPETLQIIDKTLMAPLQSNQIDVTGGMYGKIKELIEAAKQGIEILIINAKNTNNIEKTLKNNIKIGTRFVGWF